MNDLFQTPPFEPGPALLLLKRSLRDLRPLVEHGNGYELNGKRVIELRGDASFITARLARRPAMSPDWDTMVLKSSADVRKCVDEVKKRLARWTEE
ncbi:hypothetical protein [Piscinibacter sp.]|jgi:hypothetical protein|uniref:hypothetical protein n=1 Tax=Piscinibacter sp. TaxID=1903157 RepID=UPI00355994EF